MTTTEDLTRFEAWVTEQMEQGAKPTECSFTRWKLAEEGYRKVRYIAPVNLKPHQDWCRAHELSRRRKYITCDLKGEIIQCLHPPGACFQVLDYIKPVARTA